MIIVQLKLTHLNETCTELVQVTCTELVEAPVLSLSDSK